MTNTLAEEDATANVEWQCPYCDQTRQSLGDIREHITTSTEGDHHGIDGLKPTEDIVAYDTDGDVAERIEGVSTEAADPIEDYDKRSVIINAWLAANRDPDRKAIQAISGASQQYISRLLRELESGDIPRETWTETINYGLQEDLAEWLAEYQDTTATEDQSMSTQTERSPDDIIEESTKKERIIAAHRVSPSADKQAVADVLDVSYEYVRQIFNDIESRSVDEWQKLREGDLEADPDPSLKSAVEQKLQSVGAVDTAGDEVEELSGSSDIREGNIASEDVQEVRKKLDLLREQAEYTEDKQAAFIARKSVQWLDELLEKSQ